MNDRACGQCVAEYVANDEAGVVPDFPLEGACKRHGERTGRADRADQTDRTDHSTLVHALQYRLVSGPLAGQRIMDACSCDAWLRELHASYELSDSVDGLDRAQVEVALADPGLRRSLAKALEDSPEAAAKWNPVR